MFANDRRRVSKWGKFLDSLDTGGGYVLGFFLIMGLGVYLIRVGYDMVGTGLIASASGAFFARSKDGTSNRGNQAEELQHTKVQVTSETPAPPPPIEPQQPTGGGEQHDTTQT